MFQFGEDVVQLDPDNIEVAISRERQVISGDIFLFTPRLVLWGSNKAERLVTFLDMSYPCGNSVTNVKINLKSLIMHLWTWSFLSDTTSISHFMHGGQCTHAVNTLYYPRS
jgi:hypothetical protein